MADKSVFPGAHPKAVAGGPEQKEAGKKLSDPDGLRRAQLAHPKSPPVPDGDKMVCGQKDCE